MPTVDKPAVRKDLEGQEAVRDVFKRGCGIHCPNRALIHLKFAEFEECWDNVEDAKAILKELIKKHPLLIEATMHLIDIERRAGEYETVTNL